MAGVRLGANLWSQATDWKGFLDAAVRADQLGYDHVWTWVYVQFVVLARSGSGIFFGLDLSQRWKILGRIDFVGFAHVVAWLV